MIIFSLNMLFFCLAVFLMFTNIQNNSLNNFNTHDILMSDSRDGSWFFFLVHGSFVFHISYDTIYYIDHTGPIDLVFQLIFSDNDSSIHVFLWMLRFGTCIAKETWPLDELAFSFAFFALNSCFTFSFVTVWFPLLFPFSRSFLL